MIEQILPIESKLRFKIKRFYDNIKIIRAIIRQNFSTFSSIDHLNFIILNLNKIQHLYVQL